jgi:c-di-GMP-binding flagellar brake protein YcgR
MTTSTNPADQRRNHRVTIPEHPQILDAHSGEVIGQLVNLSSDGLMIASANRIQNNTVLQMRIPLVRDGHHLEIRIGAESLWCEDANDSGTHWSGFQIIDISPEDQRILDRVIGN